MRGLSSQVSLLPACWLQVVVEVHAGAEGRLAAVAALLRERGFRVAVEPQPDVPGSALVYAIR